MKLFLKALFFMLTVFLITGCVTQYTRMQTEKVFSDQRQTMDDADNEYARKVMAEKAKKKACEQNANSDECKKTK